MHHEVINEQRNAEGGLEVQTLYMLSDSEAEQHKRAGLARHGLENILSQVHHVLSPSRSAIRGQHIITNAEDAMLHASGEWMPPDLEREDPSLWQWVESGAGLSEWVREDGLVVPSFGFAPTSGEDEMEYLDPQWRRETLVRDPQIEIAQIGEWKAELLDDKLTRGEPIQEVQLTTLNLQIGAYQDEGRRWGASSFSSGDNLSFGAWTGGTPSYHVNNRFTSVTIPGSATIDSVTAQFNCRGGGGFSNTTNTIYTNLYCEDQDDPTRITSYSDFDGRTTTSAFTAWDSLPAWYNNNWYTSADFTSAVQEYSDRAGRASGNALTIFVKNDGSSATALRYTTSYGFSSSRAAKLDIDYTAAATNWGVSRAAGQGGLAGSGGLAGKGGGLAS